MEKLLKLKFSSRTSFLGIKENALAQIKLFYTRIEIVTTIHSTTEPLLYLFHETNNVNTLRAIIYYLPSWMFILMRLVLLNIF